VRLQHFNRVIKPNRLMLSVVCMSVRNWVKELILPKVATDLLLEYEQLRNEFVTISNRNNANEKQLRRIQLL